MVVNHVHGNINLLKYFYIFFISPTTHCRIISLKKIKWFFCVYSIRKFFVGIDGLFYVCKMVEIHHQFLFIKKNLFYLKIFISKIWQLFCLHFPLNFHYFSIFFPKIISKLGKFKTKKKCWLGRGFSSTISCQSFH